MFPYCSRQRKILLNPSYSGPIPRAICHAGKWKCLETAKGCHKVFDLAGRRGFAGFEVALNA
jgi:hypothetical protein